MQVMSIDREENFRNLKCKFLRDNSKISKTNDGRFKSTENVSVGTCCNKKDLLRKTITHLKRFQHYSEK
jgi:hypothetical protein